MIEQSDEMKKWIKDHINDDPHKLRLSWHNKAPWISAAINHIENYKNTRRKFHTTESDMLRLIPEFMPIKLSTEQATSASIASLHYKLSGLEHLPRATVLDMTCGLGIDTSFLAMQPTVTVTSIELNQDIAQVAKHNFEDRSNITIINCDSIDFLKTTDNHFNLIFIDPARRDNAGARVYNLHDCSPDIIPILPLMKQHADRIMIKMSPMLDISQTISDLTGLTTLNIVEERNECRELLAIIDSNRLSDAVHPKIAVWRENVEVFSYTIEDETKAVAHTDMPKVGEYLYEPSPAIMKAAPFKLLSQRFGISQLSNNTHLYISYKVCPQFPGTGYIIEEILPYTSSNIKKLARLKIKADVAVRNFTISAEALSQKLNIRQSGPLRLMGVTLADNRPYLLLLRKP